MSESLVSEAFVNRFPLDTAAVPFSVHGPVCDGFLTEHFEPHLLSPEVVSSGVAAVQSATNVSWEPLNTAGSVVDFTRLFDETENRVAYVAEVVHAAEAREVVLSLGSDDGLTVWFGGDTLLTRHQGRELRRHDDLVRVPLRAGANVLLYKVDQGDGGWALYRRLVETEEWDDVLDEVTSRLWADLPESAILPDDATHLLLKRDERRHLDTGRSVRLAWESPPGFVQTQERFRAVDTVGTFSGPALPDSVALPSDFDGGAVFTVTVLELSGEEVFRERIPVFTSSTAETLAKRLSAPRNSAPQGSDPGTAARRSAARLLFGLDTPPASDQARPYSTRFKAEALYDLLLDSLYEPIRPSGPLIGGYRSADGPVQTYRAFVPYASGPAPGVVSHARFPLAFVSYGVLGNAEFWTSKEGASHALMARRAALATDTGVLIAQPHGHGRQNYRTDFESIAQDLYIQGLASDSAGAAILAFSDGAGDLVDALLSERLPLRLVGIVAPVFPDAGSGIATYAQGLKARYPDLHWFVRHGMDDSDSPIHVTRAWVEALQRAGFEVDYEEMPHSSHWVWLGDPEREFYELTARTAR